jgi:hypothetical protein
VKKIRNGGGVYIYRTRKPASLIGKLRLKARYVYPVATVAGGALYALDGPWYLAIPAAVLATGRHFGYVGETVSFEQRHGEHISGGGRFKAKAKPWADLDPVCVLRLRLPRWKFLLRSTETLFMLILSPVYNHAKNQWNPRRIPLDSARRQRYKREARDSGWSGNFRAAHMLVLIATLILGLVVTR